MPSFLKPTSILFLYAKFISVPDIYEETHLDNLPKKFSRSFGNNKTKLEMTETLMWDMVMCLSIWLMLMDYLSPLSFGYFENTRLIRSILWKAGLLSLWYWALTNVFIYCFGPTGVLLLFLACAITEISGRLLLLSYLFSWQDYTSNITHSFSEQNGFTHLYIRLMTEWILNWPQFQTRLHNAQEKVKKTGRAHDGLADNYRDPLNSIHQWPPGQPLRQSTWGSSLTGLWYLLRVVLWICSVDILY